MNLLGLAVRNLRRNRFRTGLTALGVAVAILAFIMLRTVISAWNNAADYAAQDRIATRHKVSFVISLPKRYIETVRATPGVKAATWMNWFGAKYPARPNEFFGNMAVDAPTFLSVYDEMLVPEQQKARWLEDRQGALVGDVLARKLGWKVGDRVTLRGTIFPGDWTFTVDAIYTATRQSIDRSSFFFHWTYLNDSIPARRQDQIGWVVSRITDANGSANVSAAIDRTFDVSDVQTVTMSERAMNLSFMGMMSAVLRAIDIVSLIILVIMMMILGNTIAMGVRERTNEYGVLRAIGFLPRHLSVFILGEAATLGLLGGLLGLGLAYLIVQRGMGRWLEENFGSWFPYFRVTPTTWGLGLGLAVLLGLLAAALPALRTARLSVTESLRRVG